MRGAGSLGDRVACGRGAADRTQVLSGLLRCDQGARTCAKTATVSRSAPPSPPRGAPGARCSQSTPQIPLTGPGAGYPDGQAPVQVAARLLKADPENGEGRKLLGALKKQQAKMEQELAEALAARKDAATALHEAAAKTPLGVDAALL